MLASPLPIPVAPTLPIIHEVKCRIKLHDRVNGQYRRIVLDVPPELPDCRPGQFFHLLCPKIEGFAPFFRRPMSIYGFDAGRGELEFLYKVAGEGTGAMSRLEIGQTLDVVGPLGKGFDLPAEWDRPLLVARGVGLATLAPLAAACARISRPLTAICSARSNDLLMSLDLFRSYGATVITVTDEDGSSQPAQMAALIEDLIGSRGINAFYTCGSSRLMRMLQDIGSRHAIPGQVALEQHMACGIGMCQCCVRPFRRDGQSVNLRVCREGPVFDLGEVL